ncbi:MarR family transcriptional regulator [Sporolactobacillus sp. CPB3-1]|uniref:MarR family transcriptional regulator n=1 Tax=Sporolactobacillus mangiferae TaxID=2940498 RepID=A0ABT0M673_9BACL|nr:MarR family transcriptional regulator [Sporolactobacillus mangiferae]MCL1630348.1 MarR family transcriptional regulator [Sporolactobacillus mangiferae]
MESDSIHAIISAYENLSVYTTDQVQEAVQKVIKKYGITFEQFCLLRLLELKPGTSPIQIADYFNINKSGVSIRIGRLVDKGYIEKKMIDNRSHGLYTTEAGKELFLKGQQKIHELVGEWIRELGEEDSKEFIRIYWKINEIIKKQRVNK